MNKYEFFKSLGFTNYEIKTILSLIKLKVATPKEISLNSGVPQNKLYQILLKFENEGILSRIPSDIKKYKLINLKSFINSKIKEKENNIRELKDNSKRIEEINENEEEFIFSLIKGQRGIMNKLSEKNLKVKKEILGVQRNWKVWSNGLNNMKKTIKNGVNVKMIGIINEETKDRALEWKKIGCKIKIYNEKFGQYPLRFTIFDNKEARITIGKPEIANPEDYITIWTKSRPLINTLRTQFINMWKNGKNFN